MKTLRLFAVLTCTALAAFRNPVSAESEGEHQKSPADSSEISTPDSAAASDESVSRSADYKAAKAAEAEGKNTVMLEHAKKLVGAYPESPLAYKCLADALFYTHALQDALTAANKAIAINAKDSVAWDDLGSIYRAMKRHKDAEFAYKQALKLSEEPKFRADLGALYLQQKRKGEAAVETDKAARSLKAKPFNTHHGELQEVWVWRTIGENYLDMKRPLDAEKAFNKVAEIEPTDAAAWHYLGLAYDDQEKWSEAIAAFKKAVEIKSDYWLSLSSLGSIYLTMKKPSEAVAVLEQAARVKPDEDMIWEDLGEAYRDLGRKTDAIAAYGKVIEIQPRNAEAWHDLAWAHLDGFTAAKLEPKDISEAEAALKKAIEIKPDYAEAWDTLGFAYSLAERPSESAAAFAEVVRIEPKNYRGWESLGESYEKQGRLLEAVGAYRKMVKLKPSVVEGWNCLGRALIKQGTWEGAVGAFRKSAALTPNDATSWFWLGLAYEKQRKLMEAASAYARANQLRPGTVEEVKSNFGIVSEARQKYLAEVAAAEAHSRAMDLLLDRAEAAWKAKHPESTNPPPIPDPKPPAPAAGALTGNSIGVDLVREMGVLKVPVLINGAITLKFVVDSGASDVHIPRDVFLTLMRAETIKESDFLPGSTFVLADGSKVKSDRFILRSIKVGGSTCSDVEASIGGLNSTLLLGQSFLSRFPEWKINNKDGKLILNK